METEKGFCDLVCRKHNEQEKKVKGGEEIGVMTEGIETATRTDTGGLVFSCPS